MTIAVGQPAPSFRLPAGQGGQIGLDDYRGRKSVIVWFTKGMCCPFCRSHMSQLARGYSKFKALGAELIEVTPTTPERARSYVQKFRIPFPYLCDPDYQSWRVWGRGPIAPDHLVREPLLAGDEDGAAAERLWADQAVLQRAAQGPGRRRHGVLHHRSERRRPLRAVGCVGAPDPEQRRDRPRAGAVLPRGVSGQIPMAQRTRGPSARSACGRPSRVIS